MTSGEGGGGGEGLHSQIQVEKKTTRVGSSPIKSPIDTRLQLLLFSAEAMKLKVNIYFQA